MKNFLHIASGINISPLAMALQLQPELWNNHNERKEFEGTAHKGTSDIWLRYNDLKNLKDDYVEYTKEHNSVWLPASEKLPQIRPIVFGLMAKCEATRLGGVLITRIPAGGHVLPHSDHGWHPEYYHLKVYVPILANTRCVNRVEDEHVIMAPGDAWHFNNTVEHEVTNNGDTERVTLIICMRTD